MASNYLSRAALDTDTQFPKTGIVADVTTGEVDHTMNVYGAVQTLEAAVGIAGSGGTTTPTNAGDLLVCTTSGATTWRSILLFARKTANEAVASSTTLQNDDHLFLSVAANSTYVLSGIFYYDGATTGDIKFTWTVPASATLDWTLTGPGTGVSSVPTNVKLGHLTTDIEAFGCIGTGTTNHIAARLSGLLVVAGTAGTLQLQWAQNASDATATTVYTNSFITLARVV